MREKGAEGSRIVGGQRRGAGKSSKKRGAQRQGMRRKLRRGKKNLELIRYRYLRVRGNLVFNGQISAHPSIRLQLSEERFFDEKNIFL
jgi:hypothetical protein